MKYLIWILMLFAAAVAMTTAAENPAYVLLVYPPYRIELSLMLFVILLLFTFVSGYGVLRVILAAMRLPASVHKFRHERAQAKARELLDQALGAYFEGRYGEAERAAAHAIELDEPSALYPIVAARAAHELREYEKRDAYLSAIEDQSAHATTMRLMAAARFMLDQRDPHGALRALQDLRASGVRDYPGMLALELKAQQQAGNWDEVLDLLAQLEKRNAVDPTAATQLGQKAWLEKIRQQEDLAGIERCLKAMPVNFKWRSRIAATAAQAMIRFGNCVTAQKLLTDSLNVYWDSELIALYGDCSSGEVVAQIEQAETWLNQHPNDAGLLLALGKLCLHQKLWGKAQSYLEASLSVEPSHAAYNTLAQLAERLGKSDEAFKYYQSAVALK